MNERCPFCGCEQVDWRTPNGRIGWTCGTNVGGPVLPPSQSESCRIRQLEASNAEYEATFALQRERMAQATAAWQAATGQTDRLPDLGDLLSWLLARIAEGEAEVERLRAEIEAWQEASQLCRPPEEEGGDPGGVRPQDLDKYMDVIHAENDTAYSREAALRDALVPLAGLTQGLHQWLCSCRNAGIFEADGGSAKANAEEWIGELEQSHYAIGDALRDTSPAQRRVEAAVELAEAAVEAHLLDCEAWRDFDKGETPAKRENRARDFNKRRYASCDRLTAAVAAYRAARDAEKGGAQ